MTSRPFVPTRLDPASLLDATRRLARRDPMLGEVVRRHGPPPLWARPAGFATLLRIILEQQVSLVSARAVYRRLAAVTRVTPGAVLALGEPGLRGLGFTRQKARYVFALAEAVASRRLVLAELAGRPADEVRERLLQVPGIGPWTASIYLLMALRHPDVWPTGDIALHQALTDLGAFAGRPGSEAAEAFAERWRPYRSVAARILWHAYLRERAARTRRIAGPPG